MMNEQKFVVLENNKNRDLLSLAYGKKGKAHIAGFFPDYKQ